MKYLVIEIQTAKKDGSVSKLVTVHDTLETAYQKFYTVLAAAAVSGETLSCHSAVLLDSKGWLIENKVFDREAAE